MCGRHRYAQEGCEEQCQSATGFSTEAANGLELGDLLTHGLHDAPATKHGAHANRQVAAHNSPRRWRCVSCIGVARRNQQQPDDTDGLLSIVTTVTQAVSAGRNQLQTAEPLIHAMGACAAANPGHQHHHQRTQQEAQHGRHKDEGHCLPDTAGNQRTGASLGHHSTHNAADQGVRRAAGNTVDPGDDVPANGTNQGTEHDVRIHNTRLNNALAHSGCHAQMEDKNRHHVEERSEHHRMSGLEHPRRDYGGDGIGSVVKAVHKVEQQRKRHQQNHNPEGCLYRFHDRAPARIRNSRGRCPRSDWLRLRSDL